jgi:transcriptional regulator with PAS, ATPase and Fis domain
MNTVTWIRKENDPLGSTPSSHSLGDEDFTDELTTSDKHSSDFAQMVAKVAESNAPTILLEGESGTGKNLLARFIHLKSRRAQFPFMEINCASLPETLIENELFGHEKGAFTDAKEQKMGLFDAAYGGTLFLDEIGEMSLSTQAKLLQAIESHCFRRVGGVQGIEMNVRIIASTNIQLKQAVAAKKFREDLYFRLQLIPIQVVPLRQRTEDIPAIVAYFIKKFNNKYHREIQGFSPEAEQLLKAYAWPGNIRELKNFMERIAILNVGPCIETGDLPSEIRTNFASSACFYEMPQEGINLEEVEKHFILQALKKTGGNQSNAAKLLGITRHTLRYRMEKFGLT